MSEVFSFDQGDSALLISIPHDGRLLAPGQAERLSASGSALPDTDWHVRRLYAFAADLGATVLAADYSRYVVDLNRPADDAALYPGQLSTGLCPTRTFAGEPIYLAGDEITEEERARRVRAYWRPYHERLRAALDTIRARFGYALLWDAHSIAGEVPLLFDGVLPDLNLGTNDGLSCGPALSDAVAEAAMASPYSSVVNGRFRGGYITRHYGNPARRVHAIQLELAQRTYMDETCREFDAGRAEELAAVLRRMLDAFITAAVRAG